MQIAGKYQIKILSNSKSLQEKIDIVQKNINLVCMHLLRLTGFHFEIYYTACVLQVFCVCKNKGSSMFHNLKLHKMFFYILGSSSSYAL